MTRTLLKRIANWLPSLGAAQSSMCSRCEMLDGVHADSPQRAFCGCQQTAIIFVLSLSFFNYGNLGSGSLTAIDAAGY